MSNALQCPICDESDPKKFGICRARKSGRNLYCKRCVLGKVRAGRKRKKEFKQARTRAQERAAQEIAELERKPNVVSPILRKPVSKVWFAVKGGYGTRAEIKEVTGLGWDDIGDALAELAFDRNHIRLVKIDGEFHAIAA